VMYVQTPVPARVKKMVGAAAVNEYYREEATKVLTPITRFLQRHAIPFKTDWTIGSPAVELVEASRRTKAQMIVMGTHGHGLLGRALLGSVAQNVLTQAQVPVLLVK